MGSWPTYRVSQGALRTMQHRLWDCYRQQRWPVPEYGSDGITALTVFLNKQAQGGEINVPVDQTLRERIMKTIFKIAALRSSCRGSLACRCPRSRKPPTRSRLPPIEKSDPAVVDAYLKNDLRQGAAGMAGADRARRNPEDLQCIPQRRAVTPRPTRSSSANWPRSCFRPMANCSATGRKARRSPTTAAADSSPTTTRP